MKTRTFFFTLIGLLAITSTEVFAQKVYCDGPDDPLNTKEFLFFDDQQNSFIISRDLTTNKEYLTYLAWLYHVHIEDIEYYYYALPDSSEIDKLFDPEYAYEPVKGVSLEQAQEFCIWKADRINEMILIREGILHFDPFQVHEWNFSTDAYFCGQYQGQIKRLILDPATKKERQVVHSDKYLIPSLHVASEKEIMYAKSVIQKIPPLKTPSKVSSPLDRWLVYYLLDYSKPNNRDWHPLSKYHEKYMKEYGKISDNGSFSDAKKLIEAINKKRIFRPVEFRTENVLINPVDQRFEMEDSASNYIFYIYNADSIKINPFDSANKNIIVEKNDAGRLPFVWIADKIDGSPVFAERPNLKEKTETNNEGFYCAMNLPLKLLLKCQTNFKKHGVWFLYKK